MTVDAPFFLSLLFLYPLGIDNPNSKSSIDLCPIWSRSVLMKGMTLDFLQSTCSFWPLLARSILLVVQGTPPPEAAPAFISTSVHLSS